MNISFSATNQKKGNLGYGLNSRSSVADGSSTKNVFGDDNSDEEECNEETANSSGRQAVNQQIAKEQAALRKRAQAILTTVEDPSMYDYDGAYDTFKSKQDDADDQAKKKAQEDRKSKYIGDLLKAAQVRERERDAIYERRIAREQAEEDAKEEFSGKEKFVTKAYKRKLEERKQWELEQEEKERQEDANDVTKKSAGAAFASFYGNLNKNVAAGGDRSVPNEEENGQPGKNPIDSYDDFDPRGGFMADFEKSTDLQNGDAGEEEEQTKEPTQSSAPVDAMSMRERRQKKIAEARIRYLKRREDAMAALQ
ncbi:coiled-coil domain containing protein [Nitzschia inconspicua]|uniref:Coiled-coil domain containing protein n=1 Tax=Nitzschia inconspicua TaxID=303405 RepID=A0A9K3KVM6_9STRA|nr:coiled-coil domain containing protein [Nitzschia inconspicua]